MLEASYRLAARGALLGEFMPVLLQLLDALFVGVDHRGRAGLDDAVQKLLDLPLNLVRLGLERLRATFLELQTMVPECLEHPAGDRKQPFRGLKRFQEPLKFPFQGVSLDGFTVARATFVVAQVIGNRERVALCSSRRSRGGRNPRRPQNP